MASQLVTPPLETDFHTRKRVCKACDRCRLKKSKCDGVTPCSRCRADNAICVFGERKKTHDKVYPKGYVEMLEQQQAQLVNGLQELYKRLTTGEAWEGPLLDEGEDGRPLTHDILNGLGVLQHESGSPSEAFEDDLEALQHRLLDDGTQPIRRTHSPDSDEEVVSNASCFMDLQPDRPFQMDNLQMPSRPTFPANAQNLYSQRSWPGAPASAPVRTSTINPHPLYSSTIKSNPNLMALNSHSWMDSPMTYEDNNSFLHMNGFSNLDDVTTDRTSISPLAMENGLPATMAPTWTEDDFTKFLNSTLGQ